MYTDILKRLTRVTWYSTGSLQVKFNLTINLVKIVAERMLISRKRSASITAAALHINAFTKESEYALLLTCGYDDLYQSKCTPTP